MDIDEEETLCALMNNTTTNNIDRKQEIITMGKLINEHIDYYSEIPWEFHENLLDKIKTTFLLYKVHFFIDDKNPLRDNDNDIPETPKEKIRVKAIYYGINSYLLYRTMTPVRILLHFAKQVFIHLYLIVFGDLGDPDSQNIEDYPKPITFNAHV